MVTSEEHAARLRILRTCLGMLAHKDGDLVFEQSQGALNAANDLVLAIRKATPITEEDCHDYGKAAAAEMQVTMGDGKYRFSYKGSGKPVTLNFRNSPVPPIKRYR